jgi:hypothetical protein
MKFYHGTNETTWIEIQRCGYLKPCTIDPRLGEKKSLHFADGPDIAKNYGSVVLEIEWDRPVMNANQNTSFAIFEMVPLSKIRKLSKEEIKSWSPYKNHK